MRVAFAGTPAFAAAALDELLRRGFEVPLVFSQPDRPAGRGQQVQSSAVKQLALAHSVHVAQPQGLKLDGRFAHDAHAAREALQRAAVDAMVVAAYGLILPAWLLESPRLGCINIHASLLPRWRGAAPIQRAIEAGDAHTGITIIRMDEGLDTGAMLAHEAIDIDPGDTAGTLHDRLAPLGARLAADVLAHAAKHGPWPDAVPQPPDGVTYAAKINKDEATIDWHQDAAAIERRVRAFDPAPGCSFVHGGQTLKLWRARVIDRAPALDGDAPGTVRADGAALRITCGHGTIEVIELQKPGGRRIDARTYVQGLRPKH